MKKVTALFCLVSISLIALTSSGLKYQDDYSLAQVYELDGKYVFFYSKPYHMHDTVFTISTMVLSNNPDKAIKAVMKKAIKIASQRGVEFDGIITGQAQYDYAIKFK